LQVRQSGEDVLSRDPPLGCGHRQRFADAPVVDHAVFERAKAAKRRTTQHLVVPGAVDRRQLGCGLGEQEPLGPDEADEVGMFGPLEFPAREHTREQCVLLRKDLLSTIERNVSSDVLGDLFVVELSQGFIHPEDRVEHAPEKRRGVGAVDPAGVD
jgi:hypothetical protein